MSLNKHTTDKTLSFTIRDFIGIIIFVLTLGMSIKGYMEVESDLDDLKVEVDKNFKAMKEDTDENFKSLSNDMKRGLEKLDRRLYELAKND